MATKSTRKPARKKASNRSPFASIIFTLAALVFIVGSLVNLRYILTGDENIFVLFDIKKENERIKISNERLTKENKAVREFVNNLRNDSDVIEEEIRRKLNYVKKGEVFYIEDQDTEYEADK
ncbi:MAG: septum formation initiator family protein [Candidatus Portiera sp.]|nr:septum formation initiator family protein [Portiera sp.]